MATCMQNDLTKEANVGMGQIAVGVGEAKLKAVVGSCIGLILFRPRQATAVFGHIVLPNSFGHAGAPGKFADTAVPEMLRLLKERGVSPSSVVAKLAGGASMFGGEGPMQIGEANAQAVAQALRVAGVRVVGEDVGGTAGRRVTFVCKTGDMIVEQVGARPKTI